MQITYRIVDLSEAERDALTRGFDKKRSKIERQCGRTKDAAATLRVNARKFGHPLKFRVAINLTLRTENLFAERLDLDVLSAVDRVVEALLEEIRSHHAFFVRDVQKRRHGRITHELEKARPYLAVQAQTKDREAFEARLRPLLKPLYALAVRELRLRQVASELTPGELEPAEVVDEVVARAFETFGKSAEPSNLSTWLTSEMIRFIDEESIRAQEEPSAHPEKHFDDEISENDPRLEVNTEGDEALEFYQPDDQFHLEDILAGAEIPDPAAMLSAREQMRLIHRALKILPRSQRQAFMLHADGFDDMEIGMIQKRTSKEVREDIEATRICILEVMHES